MLKAVSVKEIPNYKEIFFVSTRWCLIDESGDSLYAFRTKKAALAAESDPINYPAY
ncbi:hypothetical protein [Cohnella boryungensis]|uniref:PLAT domain-containing protein n=1 Tax=Cohnella boryungensis TaxID=768479 RepID=A0ABV8SEA5_9BACL